MVQRQPIFPYELIIKMAVIAHMDANTWDTEAEQVQGNNDLHSEFQPSHLRKSLS